MIYKILKSTLIFLLVCICLNTIAQTYPNKQVRVIVPFETGAPDSLARLIAQQLTLQTGQSFIVENRPGANGMIGADLVAKSKPDGHTLLVTSTSIVINQSYYKKVAYDLTKDLVPVTNLGSVEALFVVVNSKFPVKNLQEFLAYAKKKKIMSLMGLLVMAIIYILPAPFLIKKWALIWYISPSKVPAQHRQLY